MRGRPPPKTPKGREGKVGREGSDPESDFLTPNPKRKKKKKVELAPFAFAFFGIYQLVSFEIKNTFVNHGHKGLDSSSG